MRAKSPENRLARPGRGDLGRASWREESSRRAPDEYSRRTCTYLELLFLLVSLRCILEPMRTDSLSDATTFARTGKRLVEWHAILDAFDCKAKGHKVTAAFLEKEHDLTPWWSQTITVDYERAKGIREVGQRSGGKFALNVSRTMAASSADVWEAWLDASKVSTWFTAEHRHEFAEGGGYKNSDGDRGVYKKIVALKRIEMTWDNPEHCPGTLVVVEFLSKGPAKTTVAVTHEKLESKAAVEEMREGWTWALESLRSYLESGKPILFEDWKIAKAAE